MHEILPHKHDHCLHSDEDYGEVDSNTFEQYKLFSFSVLFFCTAKQYLLSE